MTVSFYCGVPGTGKTTAAYYAARARANERGVPLLILDSEGVLPGMDTVRADLADISEIPEGGRDWRLYRLLNQLYLQGKHVRIVPADADEADAVFGAVRGGRYSVVLIDEVSYWARGTQCLPALARLLRVCRHHFVDVYMTSQYPGDVAPIIWACKTDVHIFRNDTVKALDRLEAEGVIQRDQRNIVANLPVRKYLSWSRWGPAV